MFEVAGRSFPEPWPNRERRIALSPSDQAMTTASALSGDRPRRFFTSFLSSIWIFATSWKYCGAASSARNSGSSGRATSEPPV